MPHVIVEFSGNAGEWGDQDAIAKAVHDALCSLECLPTEAIKTRAIRHERFYVGEDTEGRKGFVVVLIRTRPGREDRVLLKLSETARAAVLSRVTPVAGKTLSISVEVQTMNPVAVVHAKI